MVENIVERFYKKAGNVEALGKEFDLYGRSTPPAVSFFLGYKSSIRETAPPVACSIRRARAADGLRSERRILFKCM